ncbi:MAG: hypothetical protein WBB27_09335 [Maribacter sp.]
MKSALTILLSFLLTGAILVPTLVTLIELENDSSFVMDFNEEENKKEEKKELNKNGVFSYTWVTNILLYEKPLQYYTSAHIASYFCNTLEIFLPPPEYIG